MNNFKFTTPIVFIIFNRPDKTEVVFEAIKDAKPEKLFVISDGPRPYKEREEELCNETRRIVENIDWDCKIYTNYSDVNMGCRDRVSSGLDWVFSIVDRAIVLEDDCLPHPSFFQFCQELLDKYVNNDSIMAVSGNNFQFGKKRTQYSYYFSRNPHCWGWATWKRAWNKYDINMTTWPEIKEKGYLLDIFGDKKQVKNYEKIFDMVYEGNVNSWAYRWYYCLLTNNGVSILPNINLVSNIGFDEAGTHTKEEDILSNMEVEEMIFPLMHPPYIIKDVQADDYTEEVFSQKKPLLKRISNKVSLSFKRD